MGAVDTFAESGVGVCGAAGAVGSTGAGAAAGALHRSALVAHFRERSGARVLTEPMLLQHAGQCRVRVQSTSTSTSTSNAEAGRLGQSAGRASERQRESWRRAEVARKAADAVQTRRRRGRRELRVRGERVRERERQTGRVWLLVRVRRDRERHLVARDRRQHVHRRVRCTDNADYDIRLAKRL